MVPKYLATTLKDAPDWEPNSGGDSPTAKEKQVDVVDPVLKSVGEFNCSGCLVPLFDCPPRVQFSQESCKGSPEEKRIRTKSGKSQVPTSKVPSPVLTDQVTEYAAEVMFKSVGRAHVMNMTVEGMGLTLVNVLANIMLDDILFVWHFDHECPIRTADFNFVKNLPCLLLFLFALQ